MDLPSRVIRWALLTKRSRVPSAQVASPTDSCQRSFSDALHLSPDEPILFPLADTTARPHLDAWASSPIYLSMVVLLVLWTLLGARKVQRVPSREERNLCSGPQRPIGLPPVKEALTL